MRVGDVQQVVLNNIGLQPYEQAHATVRQVMTLYYCLLKMVEQTNDKTIAAMESCIKVAYQRAIQEESEGMID